MKNTVFPHKFWRPFLDCMPQLFFIPQYVWFPVHLKGHLIPLCYETLVVNWQNWLFTLFHQSRSVLSPNPIEALAKWPAFSNKLIFCWNIIIMLIQISLKFVHNCTINNKSALVQIMAWCWKVTSHYLNQWWSDFLMQIYVAWPQWVN